MPTLNDFSLSPVKGQMDLQVPGSVVECQVDSTVVTALVPAQPVKLVTTGTGGVPKVVPITAISDPVFGFVCYNPVFGSFAANKMVEIAMDNSVMWMEASAAIAVGATVQAVISGEKIATQTSTNTKLGTVFGGKAASADGDLIRVRIVTPNVA